MDSGLVLGLGLAVANGAVCLMLPLWIAGGDRVAAEPEREVTEVVATDLDVASPGGLAS